MHGFWNAYVNEQLLFKYTGSNPKYSFRQKERIISYGATDGSSLPASVAVCCSCDTRNTSSTRYDYILT